MYQHYNSVSVPIHRLDQLDDEADEQEDAPFPTLVSFGIWSGDGTDDEVDAEIAYLFNDRDWDSEDPWRREHDLDVPGLRVSADDLFLAANLLHLKLGTVFSNEWTCDRVVELDWQACKAAAACALVGMLPMWALVAYRDTALTQLPDEASPQASWGWPYATAHEADGTPVIQGA